MVSKAHVFLKMTASPIILGASKLESLPFQMTGIDPFFPKLLCLLDHLFFLPGTLIYSYIPMTVVTKLLFEHSHSNKKQ